jgi:hypothetical protein
MFAGDKIDFSNHKSLFFPGILEFVDFFVNFIGRELSHAQMWFKSSFKSINIIAFRGIPK